MSNLDDPNALCIHLGVSNVPIYLTDVHVPTGTQLYVERIGPQPHFGLMSESGFQYQTLRDLPQSSFMNTRLIANYNSILTSFNQ